MDEVTGRIYQSPTLSWEQLGDIAQRLYGTEADLWTVTWVPESESRTSDVRGRLRRDWNLVQDPVSRIWFCPVDWKR